MEFLYKLYSNNYFGIGLFIVITILAFTFLIILFFGKKDEKARMKQEKEEIIKTVEEPVIENSDLESISLKEDTLLQMEQTNAEGKISTLELEEKNIDNENSVSKEDLESVTQEEPIYFEETPKEEMDPFVTSNIILNTDYINEEKPSINMDESQEDFKSTSDIYNLDSIINEDIITINEEETFDDVLNKYDAIEETDIEQNEINLDLPKDESIKPMEEEKELDIFAKPEENKKTSTPFSSVYLTKEEAETKIDEPKNSASSRPAFDLPKKVELPKRNAGAINENIISSLKNDNKENHN